MPSTNEEVGPQPESPRSEGVCKARESCDLTPTESRNGATGCESEAASIVCCSNTECNSVKDTKKSGTCMLKTKCEEKPGFEPVSDMVYAGTETGATGCRHLPDDVMCCLPVADTPPSTTPECEEKCDKDDLLMCGSAFASCLSDCATDPIKCMECLDDEAAPECCPCIKERFPELGSVICEKGPCGKCINKLKDCPICATDAEKCVVCLAKKNLGKCCNCARKVYPDIPTEWTCELSRECMSCGEAVGQCQSTCASEGAIKCASCITRANAEDCCSCIKDAVGGSLPIPCPLPGSCSRCGAVFENCENECFTSPDIVQCGTCLNRHNALGCCRCLKDLGASSLDCNAITSTVNTVSGAVSTGISGVNQVHTGVGQVANGVSTMNPGMVSAGVTNTQTGANTVSGAVNSVKNAFP